MDANDQAKGVTVVVRRRPKPGRKSEFESYLKGITHSASQYPGHLGVNVFAPQNEQDGEYRVIFKFDSKENLDRWESSGERQHWRDIAAQVSEPAKREVITGLESWFTLSGETATPHPPKYKMAVVIWIGIFSLVTVMSLILEPVLARLPFLVHVFVLTAIVVILMTYIVMPLLTRLFKGWLFKE